MDEIKISLKQRYDKAVPKRQVYLDRAREASLYTIPSLIPPEGANSSTQYKQPNQSIGADGINNLSAKLCLTMLPPNSPFFKFSGDDIKLKEEAEAAGRDPEEEKKAQNEGLSKLEQFIKDRIESDGDRIILGEGTKHLLAGGNIFFVDDKDDGLKFYPLSRYVVKRDYSGNVLYAITTEKVAFDVLPEDIQEQIKDKITNENKKLDEAKEYDLLTIFERVNNKWEIYSEVEGIEIESTKGSYPIDKCPFIALRYVAVNGEDYGRGFIEEYFGDLVYLDVISKAVKEASLAMSKFIVLVDPNGITRANKLKETENGGFCVGREQDVHVMQANKVYDIQTAQAIADKIEKRLQRVFLLAQSATRDAERVTAQEIAYMVKQLEEALGNLYSILSKDFQKPYLTIKYHHLKLSNKSLPDVLKDGNISLTITTGIEALGRSSELQKWSQWIQLISESQVIAQFGGDIGKLGDIYATSLGLDVKGILPTKQEVEAQQQNAQQQEVAKSMVAPLTQQGGQMIQNIQKGMIDNGGEGSNG